MIQRMAFTGAILMGLWAAPAAAQLMLLDEDFDAGIPSTWTAQQNGPLLEDDWTVGFGLVNGSGDVNHEWFCTGGNTIRDNRLISPFMDFTGLSNIVLTFDQYHETFVGLAGANKYNRVEVSVRFGPWVPVYDVPESPDPDGLSSVSVSLNAYANQEDVRIGFHYRGTQATDWNVDDVRIGAIWENLGQALAGAAGAPTLQGLGPLTEGNPMAISLTGAAPLATAYLVVGFSEIDLPFYGGTLVPAFEPPLGTFFTLGTNASGALPIQSAWPSGVPSGLEMILQYWVVDAGAPFGLAASNALKGHVP